MRESELRESTELNPSVAAHDSCCFPLAQMINGEMYPPTVRDTQAEMLYPPHVPEHLQFSVGQEVFGLVPGLMMYATIWLREHNRVCDILKRQHPEWDDEQLFQTTRLILIGEGPCCCVQLQLQPAWLQ